MHGINYTSSENARKIRFPIIILQAGDKWPLRGSRRRIDEEFRDNCQNYMSYSLASVWRRFSDELKIATQVYIITFENSMAYNIAAFSSQQPTRQNRRFPWWQYPSDLRAPVTTRDMNVDLFVIHLYLSTQHWNQEKGKTTTYLGRMRTMSSERPRLGIAGSMRPAAILQSLIVIRNNPMLTVQKLGFFHLVSQNVILDCKYTRCFLAQSMRL